MAGLSVSAKEKNVGPHDEIVAGLREAGSLALAILPFAAVFGAASVTKGFSLGLTMLSSITIFAGASQFVFIEIYGAQVPGWMVVLTVFAVNFRHILYSAAIGRKLGRFGFLQKALAFFLLTDLQFAAGESRAEKTGELSTWFYFAFGAVCYSLWVLGTFLGAVFGQLIENPAALGFDYVLPIYFLVILLGFHKRNNFAVIVVFTAIVSIFIHQTLGPPFHVSLAALVGIGLAAILGGSSGRISEAISGDDEEGGND